MAIRTGGLATGLGELDKHYPRAYSAIGDILKELDRLDLFRAAISELEKKLDYIDNYIAFDATNFAGTGAMTFVVVVGNIITARYRRINNEVTLNYSIQGCTIGGIAANQLVITLPRDIYPSGTVTDGSAYYQDVAGGVQYAGIANVGAGGTVVNLFMQNLAVFPITANFNIDFTLKYPSATL